MSPDAAGFTGPRRERLLLAAAAGISFFLFLDRLPVFRRQEVRVLETAREMGESGDLIVPRFCGRLRFEKPPLAYWLALLGFRLRGEPDEASGRLFSAAAGVLTVLLVHDFGRSLARPRAGLWAGLILAASPLFFRFARRAETDVLLACAATAAACALWRALAPGEARPGRRRLWAMAAWGAMGIGVLAKGPAGVTFPLIPAAAYLALGRRWRGFAVLFHPLGVALFAAVAVPWFVAAASREGVAVEVFARELWAVTEGLDHARRGLAQGALYYPLQLASNFAPWSALLLPAAVCAGRGLRGERGPGFLLAWAGGILLQLQCVGNLQVHYAIPALPPLALLVGWWIERLAGGSAPLAARWLPRAAAVLAAATLAGLLAWAFWNPSHWSERKSCRSFCVEARQVVKESPVHLLGLDGLQTPLVCFYLRRVAPGIEGGREELERLLGSGSPCFLVAPAERRKDWHPELPALDLDERFELVRSSSPPEMPLRLYRAAGGAAAGARRGPP